MLLIIFFLLLVGALGFLFTGFSAQNPIFGSVLSFTGAGFLIICGIALIATGLEHVEVASVHHDNITGDVNYSWTNISATEDIPDATHRLILNGIGTLQVIVGLILGIYSAALLTKASRE